MAMKVQWISLTHEQLHFSLLVCERSPYDLINVLGHFSVISQPQNVCKVEFSNISSALETMRKIAKCFDLLGCN